MFFHPNHFTIGENCDEIIEKNIKTYYRASSSPNRGIVGVVEPLRGEVMISFGFIKFEFVDVVVSLCPVRRLGSLSERDEVFDDVDVWELSEVDDVDLSSIDPFLDAVDGTDVVDGNRPRRLKR